MLDSSSRGSGSLGNSLFKNKDEFFEDIWLFPKLATISEPISLRFNILHEAGRKPLLLEEGFLNVYNDSS